MVIAEHPAGRASALASCVTGRVRDWSRRANLAGIRLRNVGVTVHEEPSVVNPPVDVRDPEGFLLKVASVKASRPALEAHCIGEVTALARR
jgi:hypothetical protein